MDKRIIELLQKLPKKQVSIYLARKIQNLKYKEIAEIFHVETSTVGKYIHDITVTIMNYCDEHNIPFDE